MTRAFLAALAAATLLATGASALECRDDTYLGDRYTLCEASPGDEMRLFLKDGEDKLYGQFSTIDRALAAEGKRLAFAMNAGMYHNDRRPVGHYVERGEERMGLVTNPGPGNFGLLPNGVFCIAGNRAQVYETLAFEQRAPACDYATQSGPMLVIDGELHPRFLPDSDSRYVRNGVGTSADGTRTVFAISRNAVTFHSFARLFRDRLELPNALYFDGNISRLYAPELGRNDAGFAMGPIVGIVAPAE